MVSKSWWVDHRWIYFPGDIFLASTKFSRWPRLSQMELWQNCNDTSTQLVDKTIGGICFHLVCEDVFAEALFQRTNDWATIFYSFFFFFFFLFYGKSLSSRPAINVIVSECQKFEDGEEKCNCWKVTHLKVKVNHKQQNIFEPNYWWWHNGQASIKLVERFKEKNCLSSITEPIKKVTSTLMLRNWRNSFISRNGFINRSMTFGNS